MVRAVAGMQDYTYTIVHRVRVEWQNDDTPDTSLVQLQITQQHWNGFKANGRVQMFPFAPTPS